MLGSVLDSDCIYLFIKIYFNWKIIALQCCVSFCYTVKWLRYLHTYIPSQASLVAQRVKHLPAVREIWVRFLGREDPLEKEMATHSSTLAWKIPWTEKLVGYSPWGCKESDTTERLHFAISFLSNLPSTPRPTPLGHHRPPSELPVLCSSFPPAICFHVAVYMCACVLSHSACLNLDHLDCSPPGSFVHGIFQTRILEWVAILFSRRSSDPRIKPTSFASPAVAGGFFPTEPLGKPSSVYM